MRSLLVLAALGSWLSRPASAEPVKELRNVWIPVSGGRRLAARIWIPRSAGRARPVPAILEYLPYGKAYGTRERDLANHPFLASHGYAAIRVDLAGTGESDGRIVDEYTEREQRDAEAVLRWIDKQPWSTGRVGMMGNSWGGFNALQLAARRPPQLAGIVAANGSEDRFRDGAHYKGGALLTENLLWGTGFLTSVTQPPDPRIVGERWRTMWLTRLGQARPMTSRWMRHPDESGRNYWATRATDPGNIEIPVFSVGGWADGYVNSVMRVVGGTSGPTKGLIGPWSHAYPHQAKPGPRAGFLQEVVRFFDHVLKGKANGALDEPRLRVWLQEGVPPDRQHRLRPGRWVGLAGKPEATTRYRLSTEPGHKVVASPQTLGGQGGRWAPFGGRLDHPGDQRADDAQSLVFDLPPLQARTEVLGTPILTLRLRSDQAQGHLIARLNDVAPSGESTRVSYGVLNLTHRDGSRAPRPLRRGEPTTVRLELNDLAHAFPAGHRIRVAISNAYWPIVWPAARPARLSVSPRGATLDLPVHQRRDEPALSPLPPAASAPVPPSRRERPVRLTRKTFVDPKTGEQVTRVRDDGGAWRDDEGLVQDWVGTQEYRIRPDAPLSAWARVTSTSRVERGDWKTRVEVETVQSAAERTFRVQTRLRAWENGALVFDRAWDQRVPRGL